MKELVYAYAMWISPKFHLAVIRAYDALVTGDAPDESARLAAKADRTVAAQRALCAEIRAAREMGIDRPRAVRDANSLVRGEYGIDFVADLDAHDYAAPPECLTLEGDAPP